MKQLGVAWTYAVSLALTELSPEDIWQRVETRYGKELREALQERIRQRKPSMPESAGTARAASV